MWRFRNKQCTRVAAALLISVVASGCSSIAPQEVGYVLGAIGGGVAAGPPGAAAGALLGTAAGALLAKPIENARQEKERQALAQRLNAPPGRVPVQVAQPTPSVPPPTTPPFPQPDTVQRIWIDEQVIDGRVIPGHFAERYPTGERWHASAGASPYDTTADQQLQAVE